MEAKVIANLKQFKCKFCDWGSIDTRNIETAILESEICKDCNGKGYYYEYVDVNKYTQEHLSGGEHETPKQNLFIEN